MVKISPCACPNLVSLRFLNTTGWQSRFKIAIHMTANVTHHNKWYLYQPCSLIEILSKIACNFFFLNKQCLFLISSEVVVQFSNGYGVNGKLVEYSFTCGNNLIIFKNRHKVHKVRFATNFYDLRIFSNCPIVHGINAWEEQRHNQLRFSSSSQRCKHKLTLWFCLHNSWCARFHLAHIIQFQVVPNVHATSLSGARQSEYR